MIPLVQLFAPFFDMIKNCSTFFFALTFLVKKYKTFKKLLLKIYLKHVQQQNETKFIKMVVDCWFQLRKFEPIG